MKRLLFLLFLCIQTNIFAQDIDTVFRASVKEILTLPVVENDEETVTTATKKAETISEAPAAMTVITAKEIEAFGAITLHEILDRVTSMYAIGSFFMPEGVMSMRGNFSAFNTRVLNLLNGRPMREPSSNGVNQGIYTNFPIQSIEKIEIIRGSGSVLYGSNAYVCVINVITKKPTEKLEAHTSLRYGSFGTWQSQTGVSKKIKDFSISAYLTYFKTDGWNLTSRGETDMAFRNGVETPLKPPTSFPMKKDNHAALVKADYKGFSFQWFYSNTLFNHISSQAPFWYVWQNTQHKEHYADLGYKNTWNKFSLNANINYANLSRLVFANVTANPTYVDIDARAWAGEIYLQYEVTKKLNFSLGSIITNQYAINEAANRDSQGISFNWLTTTNPDYFKVYDNSENWYSAYFQTDYQPFKFLKIDVGGQVNKAGDSPLNFVPRLNTVFNWQEKLYAKLIYGQAFRSPSINERYSNVTVIHSGFVPALVGGGSSLKPETITSSEIQLAYKHSKFQFTATYFNNQQNDLVTNSLPSDSLVIANAGEVGKKLATPKIINRGSLFSEGIELEGKTTSFRNFYLTTSASFFNIEKAGGMPNSMFKLGITYELPKTGLQIGIFNSYFGKGNEIATQFKAANPEVSAYNSLSANLNFSLKKFYVGARNMPDVIFNIYGTNLLDEQIYYVESTRRIINSLQGRAGRMIYASIAIKL